MQESKDLSSKFYGPSQVSDILSASVWLEIHESSDALKSGISCSWSCAAPSAMSRRQRGATAKDSIAAPRRDIPI
eukprot:6203125-Pleurochrysis_carterae.AAC.5